MFIKPEIQTLWADALESDEYGQITGYMARPATGDEIEADTPIEGYCCLGVLTDLFCKANGIGLHEIYPSMQAAQTSNLDLRVATWAGLELTPEEIALDRPSAVDEHMPSYLVRIDPCDEYPDGAHHVVALADLNDKGNSFSLIADRIRNQFTPKEIAPDA